MSALNSEKLAINQSRIAKPVRHLISPNMFILPPHHTKCPFSILKRLTFSHLRDLFVKWYHVSFRIYHTLTLYMSPSSPVWRFKENLTHSILIFCWNKDISSHFSQELKTPTNALAQKHSFTNLSVDHQKKCQGVCPHTE